MSLILEDVSLAFGGERYLDGVSSAFPRGRLTTIIGRTLAGKTTLMRALAGLQGTDGGDMLLDGRPFGALPA